MDQPLCLTRRVRKPMNKVNELLNTVYHGKLKLVKSKTIINESEFTIPYMKRSTLITDISKASDGEKAIISLAFSLVLLNITAGPYNILFLVRGGEQDI